MGWAPKINLEVLMVCAAGVVHTGGCGVHWCMRRVWCAAVVVCSGCCAPHMRAECVSFACVVCVCVWARLIVSCQLHLESQNLFFVIVAIR